MENYPFWAVWLYSRVILEAGLRRSKFFPTLIYRYLSLYIVLTDHLGYSETNTYARQQNGLLIDEDDLLAPLVNASTVR